ncbi:MAG: CocE/NonD family hydrolase, partial [Alphaproteobacteria bacterium]|nr:CocE/NonD family hydrolase [Alphaproteobacteria bacterium]
DPAIVGTAWRDMWLRRLDGSGLWIDTWLRHQRRDAFWKHGSVCEDFSAIQCPVFAVGGWNDGYNNAIPRLLAGLKVPRLAWIGQWAHRYPHMAAPGPAIGFLQEAVRWWDHWLKGRDSGMMNGPMLRAYMQDYVPPLARLDAIAGRWVAESAWPSPRVNRQRLYLNPGRLEPAAGKETTLTICSPQDTGLFSGKWCGHGLGPDLPTDQRQDDAGSLVFDGAVIDQPLELLGAPVVELELAANRPVALVAARLNDVAPDGAATRVTYGLLNLTHRRSHEFPEPVKPGERMRVRVQLNDIGRTIRPGHRLRLAISTSYWPIAWPAPEPVTLTVHTGASCLDLPVRPADPADARVPPLPPVVLPPALKMTTLKEGGDHRSITRDIGRGESVVAAHEDAGTRRIDEIGLINRGRFDHSYRIKPDDPNSARAQVACTVGIARGGWQIETRIETVLTSTATEFRVRARLDAFEGETRVFARDWDSTIPRDLV